MAVWAELRKRRVFQFLGGYIAGGFLVLEGVDQLVGNGILPALAYPLALVFYLFGIPGTTIIAWYHGEKGVQKPPAMEIWLQAGLLVAALAVSAAVIKNHRAAPTVESTLDPRRVAVLYFDDLTRDRELGYLADGLTEALIEKLSRVQALDVISRNGVAPYRGRTLARDSIGTALGAGSLIEGTVEQIGDEIRVTARLIDGASGVDLERASFREPAGDVIAVSDSLAQDVAGFLRTRLGEEVRLRERRAATSSTQAWTLTQKAERIRKDAEERLEEGQWEAAFDAYQRADSTLQLAEVADPQWVEPIVLRGWIAYRRARLSDEPREMDEWLQIGFGHASRALSIAPNYAEALELRGTLRYASWIFLRPADPAPATALLKNGRDDLENAVRADPSLAGAHGTLSHLYYQIDDVPAAVLAARRAYEEDAYLDLAPEILWRLFNGSLDLEQFGQAERWCLEGARRFSHDYRFTKCQLLLLATPAASPDVNRAWELLSQVEELVPERRLALERADGRMLIAATIARAGLADSTRAVLAQARSGVSAEIDPSQFLLSQEAYVLSLLGDYDAAVDLLRRYAAANPGHFEGSRGVSWWWRALKDHPGFQDLLGQRSER